MVGFARKCTISLLLVVTWAGTAAAQDNSHLTRYEYDITFDLSGQLSGGSGQGYAGTWYYYPASDRYIMWFGNGIYDPTRSAAYDFWSFIEIDDPTRLLSAEVHLGWTTPEWAALNFSAPPLPSDMDNLAKEGQYLQENRKEGLIDVIMSAGGSVEEHFFRTVSYCPSWFFVSVTGKNAHVNRQVYIGKSLDQDPPPQPTVRGACCNLQTGECYLVETGVCVFPFIYTGDGSNCATCQVQTFRWDYGDAPISYGVLSSQNGAKHVVSAGVYLGRSVSRDPDGKPGAGANGDDFDGGVLFQTQVVVGQTATVSVTASISGVINAWLDLNLDGDWLDIGEHIIVDRPVTAGTSQLTFQLSVAVLPGQSYARFRFNTTGGLSHLGEAADGEVEDYAVTILTAGGPPTPPPPTPTGATKSPLAKYSTIFSQPADVADLGTSRIGGWGILSDYALGPIMADDWTAGGAQSIQGIRWWGLFTNWTQPTPPSQLPTSFHIGIWSDNPIAPFPATLIWETTVSNWAWAYSGQLLDSRGQLGVESVFEFTSLLSQDSWFHPNPVPGTPYWISISAIYGLGQTSEPFSWMTRQNQGTSAAVVIQQIGSVLPGQLGQWPPSLGESFQTGAPVNFPAGVPWDMSFELISSGLVSSGGTGGIAPGGDLNGDGVVDVQDVSILMGLWLD